MKLGIEIEDVRLDLRKRLNLVAVDNKLSSKLINRMGKYSITKGYMSGIIEGNIMLDILDNILVALIYIELYNITGEEVYNPKRYFTDIEIEQAKIYKHSSSRDDMFGYPFVINDVVPLKYGMWTTVLPAEWIAQLNRSNMMNYNFETQRQAKEVVTSKGIIPVPSVNEKSVREIREHLIRDTFFPNTITFNIPADRDSVDFKYDEKKRTLTLLKGKLDIIDGFHRALGIIGALSVLDLDYNFIVRITNFDTETARQLIIQEDKKNPIAKEHIKSIDTTDYITIIVNEVNQNGKSALRGRVTKSDNMIGKGYAVVSFSTMYEIIDSLWKPNNMRECRQLSNYIIEMFNIIVDLYDDEFDLEPRVLQGFNGLSDERMFIVYLNMIKAIEDEDEYKREEMLIRGLVELEEKQDELLKELKTVYISTIKSNPKKITENYVEDILGGILC